MVVGLRLMKDATAAIVDSDCVSKLSSMQPPSAAQKSAQDWRGGATCQKSRIDADAVCEAVEDDVAVEVDEEVDVEVRDCVDVELGGSAR